MRYIVFSLIGSLVAFVPQKSVCQSKSGIYIGGQINLDIYKPYSEFGKEFQEKHNNISSFTYGFHAYYNLAFGQKNNLGFGISFKKIKHTVSDKFLYTEHPAYSSSDTIPYTDPFSLNSKSSSLGIHLQYDRVIHSKKNIRGLVGFTTQLYLLEFFNTRYNEDNQSTVGLGGLSPMVSDTPRNFFFSSANVAMSYALEFMDEKSVSLRLKASVGTNLYSDWDQFSKYVWIGLGAEFGIPFRKEKSKVVTE
ncbi:MAG TPA: hypothetical protein VK151_09275 [Fluviicola sp.]|nr:hypothetical protein [Fluviicola sp.]